MNKNKVIFAIIGIIILLLVIFGVLSLRDDSNNNENNTSNSIFNIWIVGDNKDDFIDFIDDFKELNPTYKNVTINIESFPNFDEYYNVLMSAIIKGKSPDLFVLNNGEKNSIITEQVIGIDSTIINPNDFRKKYKSIFSEDLIQTYMNSEDEEKEFLVGIPVGYEALGIFYNLRYVKTSDLETMSSLNNAVSTLKKSKPDIIPIGIGNGSTVEDVDDIIIQFLMLENGVTDIKNLTDTDIKQALATYFLYGDGDSLNNYNSRYAELKSIGENNLDLFSKGEIFMVMGYPSMINKIDKKGYSATFLRAAPFPHFYSGGGKTLINYNYFVVNKDTKNSTLAYDILSFMTTDTGAGNYLDKFPYYLPALLSLETDKLEEKIHKKYKIVLKDFLNFDFLLSSFDRGIKTIFDKEIVEILDNPSNYLSEFKDFQSNLICKTNKYTNLENLSQNCE